MMDPKVKCAGQVYRIMRKMEGKFTFFLLCCLLFLGWHLAPVYADSEADIPFLVTTAEEELAISKNDSDLTIMVLVSIPEGHYIYRDKTKITDVFDSKNALFFDRVDWPETVSKEDAFSDGTIQVWENEDLAIPVKLKVTDRSRLPTLVTGKITLQGCSSNVCFRPIVRTFSETVTFKDAAKHVQLNSPSPLSPPLEGGGRGRGFFAFSENPLFQSLNIPILDRLAPALEHKVSLGLILSFLGGVLTDFTPCVLPIIPLILLFIGIRRGGTWREHLPPVLSLVSGMAVSYVALGLAAVSLGWNLGFLFQSQFFLAGIVVFFAVMALSLMDVVSLQLPSSLQTRLASVGGKSLKGSFLVGLTIGLVALPCVGPIIGTILIYVASTRDWLLGALYMIAYALGMGSVFILAALVFERWRNWFQDSAWTHWVKRVLGVLFALVAVYYGYVFVKVVWPRPSIVSEVSSEWYSVFDEGLAQAKRLNRPILLDFRADWCLPCLEMERTTFVDPRVREALKNRVVPIRLDCTQDNPSCDDLADRFHVVGFPTLMILNPDGTARGPGIHGYTSAEDLLKILDQSIVETH